MVTKKSAIYLDHNATTPTDERVLGLMLPFFREKFGNSASLSHEYGWQADSAIESSRDLVASSLGCSRAEITFTSGATESNNWAIKGLIHQIQKDEGMDAKIHILSSPLEHASVISTLEFVRSENIEIEWLPITSDGFIRPEDIVSRLKKHTRLAICMWAQNEIGSINPMKEIGRICQENQVYLLSDATQAIGKVPLHLDEVHVDLLSFSAHKLYGPKGAGFLYHRKKNPAVRLTPLLHGGGHERGERSGTLNTPGVVGLAQAVKIGMDEREGESQRLIELRELFWQGLKETYPDIQLNGPSLTSGQRLPGNLNVTFTSQVVPPHIAGIAFSRGSACDTGKTSTSHVLTALGLSEEEAGKTLRFGLGRSTTRQDILQALEIIRQHIR